MNRSFSFACLVGLLIAAASPLALAQDTGAIYRGVDAQGKTVFSNNPKDMRNPKKIQISTPMVSGVDPYPVAPPAPPAAPAQPASPAGSASSQADEPPPPLSPAQAIERLEAAKAAQIAGLEPLPGERTGTANGGTRLNPSYEIRQRELAAAVVAAQKAHDAALAR